MEHHSKDQPSTRSPRRIGLAQYAMLAQGMPDLDGLKAMFVEEAYRRRNIVERLIGWLKECRRILINFENRARNFFGMLTWAVIQR